ncbi:MAG: hypothetical protein ACXABM_14470, partial [Candidatus Thorarchaeota archaeon]
MQNITNRILLSLLIVLLIGAQISISQVKAQDHQDLIGGKVAVYDGGSGVSSDPRESSAAALYWMFRWM